MSKVAKTSPPLLKEKKRSYNLPIPSEVKPERSDHGSFKDIGNGQHWNPILDYTVFIEKPIQTNVHGIWSKPLMAGIHGRWQQSLYNPYHATLQRVSRHDCSQLQFFGVEFLITNNVWADTNPIRARLVWIFLSSVTSDSKSNKFLVLGTTEHKTSHINSQSQ